jgi:hypothetical protein
MSCLKKLTLGNRKVFFQNVEEGELCTYNDAYLFDDVRKLAEEFNVDIEYILPEDPEYQQHGCYCFKIVRVHEVFDQYQMNFILKTFFQDDRIPGSENIGEKLIRYGKCVVPHKNPWIGGIGNFIETCDTPPEFVDCVELRFNINEFVKSIWFIEIYESHHKSLMEKMNKIKEELISLEALDYGR